MGGCATKWTKLGRNARAAGLAGALLALFSCSGGSPDQVLGAWVNVNPLSKISRLEFTPDDSLHIQLEGLQLAGVWDVVNKYRVKINLVEVPGQMPALETLIAIHDSTLSWTLPEKGGTLEFKRETRP